MTETAAPCERCPLEGDRAVASRGPVPARLLLLSGAPRYHEEHDGVAFASPAFAWLEETLAAAGLDATSVHYATLIGCRPPYQRPIRSEEIAACGLRLDLAINAVAPEVIVLCGPDAVAAMLPGVTLGAGHGRLVVRGRRRYFPIRHPYAALHYQRYVDEVAADLRHLADLLAEGRLDSEAPLDAAEPIAPAELQAMAQPAVEVVEEVVSVAMPESVGSLPGGDDDEPRQIDRAAGIPGPENVAVQPPDAVTERQSQPPSANLQQPPDGDGASDEGDVPAQLSLF